MNRKFCRLGLLLLLSLAIAPWASAQQLTLEQARQATAQRSATLKIAELAVTAASLAAQSQGYQELPTILLSGGADVSGTPSTSTWNTPGTSLSVSASETVFDGGKTQDLIKKYGYATEAAREAYRQTWLSVQNQADNAFYTVLESLATVDAAQGAWEASKLSLSLAQTKSELGALSPSDLLQSESDASSDETAVIQAQMNLASARAKLSSLTELPPTQTLTPVDFSQYTDILNRLRALGDSATAVLVDQIIRLSLDHSPVLAQALLATKGSNLDVSAATKAYIPKVSAGVSQGMDSTLGVVTQPWVVSLSATVDLDLWNTVNAVASAKVAAQQTLLGQQDTQTTLELNLQQAIYAWLSSGRAIISASKALQYAQANYAAVLEQYRSSSATTSDLSTAEALTSTNNTALISAQYTFLTNLAAIQNLVGIDDSATILKLVP